MDRDDDGETSYKYNTFVDDVVFEPTSLQALPTAAGRNVATSIKIHVVKTQKQSQTQSVWPVSKLSIESVGSRGELVANSCTHRRRRRDATKQFRRVGGVYWALLRSFLLR